FLSLAHPPHSTLFPYTTLFRSYVSFVDLINPKFLVLENVPGMKVAHARGGSPRVRPGRTYYDKLHAALSERGYVVEPMDLDAAKDRKSTRLNSSHVKISYAVFC